ncbi:ShlB/FhaC/HecB family hemolysin secretion/activation protein [Helicobacter sp. 13S00477-4]|uniref:ShlB/FhaC/HecB family hemolysin secretion/activation protein n=1 Tax=Helicobacter sp. 13S00477-4 TaxID=1905759 RepID=UPI000BD50DAB|nr:ShlB/FhaC/HecB family hemolysin secretion/activation protein [Helicobacter sp. 13S00477-4]PAF52260.1 hypothetical protein BKH44_02830 [Helicobacter sp. 13S00477-4]
MKKSVLMPKKSIFLILLSLYGLNAKMIESQTSTHSPEAKPLCFDIYAIEFIPLGTGQKDEAKILKKFSFAYPIAKPYQNTCMGITQINNLLKQLNLKSIDKGYITTKFGLLPQDLNSGELKISIQIGLIDEIKYQDKAKMLSFSKDFGMKKGDILNLKDIQSGIENLKRLRHLSVSAKILPSEEKSKSNIIISSQPKSLPIFAQASFDNGGNLADNYEGIFLFGIENPLHLADSMQLYLLTSIPFDKKNHSYYGSLSYTIPIRRFLFQIDSSYAHNAQVIKFSQISPVYSGRSFSFDLKMSYLVYEDIKNKLSLGLGIAQRNSDNYLDKIKLEVQKKYLNEISAFINYKRFFANSQFDITLSLLQAIPLFGSNKNSITHKTYLYTIPSLNLYFYQPFSLLNQTFVYNTAFKTQISRDELYASEKMTIGGRYTVRGFDHFSLSGQMGILYRNDLMAYLPRFFGITLAPSLGADIGYVSNITTKNPNPGLLSGGGIGLQLFSKYFNAQIWEYLAFYNPYQSPTQNLFFSLAFKW